MIQFDALVLLYQQPDDLLALLVVNGVNALHFKVRDETEFEVSCLDFLLDLVLASDY